MGWASRRIPLQWAKETDDSLDSCAIDGYECDVYAFWKFISVGFNCSPPKTCDTVMDIYFACTDNSGAWASGKNLGDVRQKLGRTLCMHRWIGVGCRIRPDFSKKLGTPLFIRLAPHLAIGIDQCNWIHLHHPTRRPTLELQGTQHCLRLAFQACLL
jgi:hypothetical protein